MILRCASTAPIFATRAPYFVSDSIFSSRSCFCCSRVEPSSAPVFMVRAPSRIFPEGRDSTFFTGAELLAASDAGGGGGSLLLHPLIAVRAAKIERMIRLFRTLCLPVFTPHPSPLTPHPSPLTPHLLFHRRHDE